MFISRKDEVESEVDNKIAMILNIWGMSVERYAKENAPVDTGNLRNSINYQVNASSKTVTIGTNVEYAVYQELGTSRMKASNSGQGFLQPAVSDHLEEFKSDAETILKN